MKEQDIEKNSPESAEPGPATAEPAAPPADALHKLEAEKKDLMDTLVRRQADFENYRKRVEKEKQHERQRGVELVLQHLLPVLDDFERALEAHADPAYEEYRKDVRLIERRLWTVLEKQGVRRIESVGKKFDPHLHHAIEQVETSEHSEGSVIAELQTGYMLHDRMLRPAMVRVARAPVVPANAAEPEED